jgi:putative tryptophan/tyrosine transport system substrate-binding protein
MVARAQQTTLPVVAFFDAGSEDVSAGRVAAFRKGLNVAGYVEAQNVTVEYHWLEGQFDGLPVLMADLVRRRVAVIATPGSDASAIAAKAATATIHHLRCRPRPRQAGSCRQPCPAWGQRDGL